MNNSYQKQISNDSQDDIVSVMCSRANLSEKCKIEIRSVLGVDVEKLLIDDGILAELLDGKLAITEHTSKINRYSHHDCRCEYNGQPAYLEVKSTFSGIGAFKQGRNIDTLIMNNEQHSYCTQLRKDGHFVIIVVYYYLDNVILLIDFRGTDFVRSTSKSEDAAGEKTFYEFDDIAVLKRIDNALSQEVRSKIRTAQWNYFRKHDGRCSDNNCAAQKYINTL